MMEPAIEETQEQTQPAEPEPTLRVTEPTPPQKPAKNPGRIAAGKRLAEWNRKQKAELLKVASNVNETAATAPRTETPETEAKTENTHDVKQERTPIELWVVIGILGLGLAYMCHSSAKSKSTKVTQNQTEQPTTNSQIRHVDDPFYW